MQTYRVHNAAVSRRRRHAALDECRVGHDSQEPPSGGDPDLPHPHEGEEGVNLLELRAGRDLQRAAVVLDLVKREGR